MADPLVNSRPRLMRVTWVAVALAVVFGAFLSLQSCFPEPKIAALSWAEESGRPSQSPIPSSQTVIGEEFQRRFREPREFRQEGMGSGVIVNADGYIVTNNHVVEYADEIDVTLADKRTFKAKVIGTDPKNDVAVIKIEATSHDLFGDHSGVRFGMRGRMTSLLSNHEIV